MDPTDLDKPGPDEELLAQPRRGSTWRWLLVAAVAVAGAAVAVRTATGHVADPARAAASPSPGSSRAVRQETPGTPGAVVHVSAPRLDAPRVRCPSDAGCAYIVGPTTVQDTAALRSAFPDAVVRHSVTFFANLPRGPELLSRRVVATRGACRIVVTVRRAGRFAGRMHARAGPVDVVAFVAGYLVEVRGRHVTGPLEVFRERATVLARDSRHLVVPFGLPR